MRIRCIKPEFWESESLGRVCRDARLLFVGLFSCCDDEGRARANSRLLASRLFPYDTDAFSKIPKWLAELEAEKCVRVYKVDGETYLDIPKWLAHQKIDKPSASKLPPFARIREDSRNIALEGEQGMGTGNRDVEGEQGTPSAPPLELSAEPVAKVNGKDHSAAIEIIEHLNAKAHRQYKAVGASLKHIEARLAEVDGDVTGIKAMIDRQTELWLKDDKMREFLRPETLFRPEKFHGYYGARNVSTASCKSHAERFPEPAPGEPDPAF